MYLNILLAGVYTYVQHVLRYRFLPELLRSRWQLHCSLRIRVSYCAHYST